MARQRLYIVQGHGNDAVGLVGSITGPIGQAGGSIVDLRQDVLHGLFTVHAVVDLTDTGLKLDDLSAMVKDIAEDTGLELSVEKYLPVPRAPDKKNLLLILVGGDRPGIIATVSELLGKYRANIELAQTIGREGLFVLELLTDVSQCRVPLPNLMTSIEEAMSALGMKTIFQTEDVFNKKKRVILFDIGRSFIDPTLHGEIVQQAGLDPEQVAAAYSPDDALASLRKAASLLEGLPADVMSAIVAGVNGSSGTQELLQTLKTMGYRIALASPAWSLLTDHLQAKLGIDHCFGVSTRIDDDSRALVGEVTSEDYAAIGTDTLIARLVERERVSPNDITVVSDADVEAAPGIRLDFDLGQMLHLHNERVISNEQLLGLLGSFGIPR